ncbi:MAG: DUF4159 domain-containing protein [Gemmatimonadaceae bacterium]
MNSEPESGSIDRRRFLQRIGLAATGVAAGITSMPSLLYASSKLNADAKPISNSAPRSSEFVFARLRYNSGDWDYNPKVCANVLDSVMRYTEIPIRQSEVVITADSAELQAFPFLFMTGHKLVRFSEKERAGLVNFVQNGGLLFSDDCNHDINGLYAKSFEVEMHKAFPGPDTLAKLPKSHSLYRSFFRFPDGPPETSHELNGWGDNVVHDYVRGVEYKGRLGVLYTNQDYGCEWDYDWKNKRFRKTDNTRFAVNVVVYAMT